MQIVVLICIAMSALGCSRAAAPTRAVLEANIDEWRYRRYQKLLDVEIWVRTNSAVSHTASYVRAAAERSGRLDTGDITSAVVTIYERPVGVLRALVEFSRRLQREAGYDVEMRSIGGVRVIAVTGQDEAWALWQSGSHIVKLGGRGHREVPGKLVGAYGDRYPSRLSSDLLDGPLPPAEPAGDATAPNAGEEGYDPQNPTPDWDQYQPGKQSPQNRK